MDFSFKHLEQAIVLGEAGSYARAAERLGVSQPTLSRNVAALEACLGVQLFDRGRGGAVPTVFGRVLMQRGSRLIGDAAALRAELRALAGLETGSLEIVAGPYVAEELIAPAVARLATERPGLCIRASVRSPDEIGKEMLGGRYELGFGGLESQLPHEELSIELLLTRRLHMACRPGHPLAGTRPTVQQVMGFPLVTTVMHGRKALLGASGSGAGRADAGRRGFAPTIEVSSIDAARQVAMASDALFPGTDSMLRAAVASGQLSMLDFEHADMHGHYALVRRRGRSLSPAANRFVQLVREVAAQWQPLAAEVC